MTPRRRIIPIFVPHLGCPHTCVFCNQRRISGKTEPQTADGVRDIIEKALCDAPAERVCVAFYGGSFTAIPTSEQEELLGAVQPFLLSGAVESVRLSTRPDAVDEETAARLKRYGVKTVELGVQSMCADVLELSERGHTAADAENAARLLKNAGFEVILQMMTGLPGDTPEKSLATAREFVKLRPDGVRVYPTVIIKDTALHGMWLAGEYKEHTVSDAAALCADIADIFDGAGIPVIRMGLNPTDELSDGAAVAGAYHAAFGELVLGRRYLKRMRALLSSADGGKTVRFAVAKGRTSAALGQKRCNARALTEEFSLADVKVGETSSATGMDIFRLDG